jgi:hypothetical protein
MEAQGEATTTVPRIPRPWPRRPHTTNTDPALQGKSHLCIPFMECMVDHPCISQIKEEEEDKFTATETTEVLEFFF